MGDVKYPVGELCTSSNTPFWSLSGTSLKFFFFEVHHLFLPSPCLSAISPTPTKSSVSIEHFSTCCCCLRSPSCRLQTMVDGYFVGSFFNLEGRRCWDDVRSFFPRPGFVLPRFILASKGWTPDYRNSLASNQRTCIHTWVNFSTLNNHTFTNMALSRIWQKEV